MNIARILYPVQVLGPGSRIGIWVCGCSRGCPGCSNPELWVPRQEYEVAVTDVLEMVRSIAEKHPVDGFTISGGEPMDQAKELAELLEELAGISGDILIYSGYKLEELKSRRDDTTDRVLATAAAMIDGAYIQEKNTDVLLRGSENQRIHLLKSEWTERYEAYLSSAHNRVQNFVTSNGVVSVGIHRRDWKQYEGE